jgi:16S rRNA C967 or C1407 C5-methylase (RsmB/RsmF family)
MLSIDSGLWSRLLETYGSRTPKVIAALSKMGTRYYFRTNSLGGNRDDVLQQMGSTLEGVAPHGQMRDAAWLPVRENRLHAHGTFVEADKFAAEAVLQGAHLYARGIRKCTGLRGGSDASVTDKRGQLAGIGVAKQGETSILTRRQGLAVEIQESRFGLPSLMETEWYQKGQIHLQSLPAMVACQVLDPQPRELVVDLNCAPGGKMSYLCQLTNNEAELVGFDRNEKKLEKTRQQLGRLGCKNYRLVAHDSRYAHLDYSLKPDKVLVDPPCTGLGVTPKLSVETTVQNVIDLASYQKQFLTAAKHLVKPGGIVVYSVCTITKDECEDMVRFGIDELGFRLEEARPMVGSHGADPEGMTQRFDPDIHGSGFFIARFRRE